MNNNPLGEKFDKISEYCQKLEEACYDSYKLFKPVSNADIENWERDHEVNLPEGYKSWLLLSNGFEMNTTADFLPLEFICKCPDPEYKDYYIIGHYIGDGSMLVTDKNGIFYQLDHSSGLRETLFEKFLDNWVIRWLEENMCDAGIF